MTKDHQLEDFVWRIQNYVRTDHRMKAFVIKLRAIYLDRIFAGHKQRPANRLANIPARYREIFLTELDIESQRIVAEWKRGIAFIEGRIASDKVFADLMACEPKVTP